MAKDKITVEYEVEIKNLEKQLKAIEKKLDGLEKKSNKSAKTFGENFKKQVKNVTTLKTQLQELIPIVSAAFAVSAIVRWSKEIFKTAVQIEAFQRRAKVVFGEAFKAVEQFANRSARSLGFARKEFIGAAAAIGDILVPLGFARSRAAEMSVEAIKLGAALKEFSGDQRTAAEIANVVAKAFTGEVEGLKSLGIVVDQTDDAFRELVQSKIIDQGATEQQAKALAIYETVIASASDAVTAYENNVDSLARTQAQLTAEIEDIQEEIAEGLTPILQDATFTFLLFVKQIAKGNLILTPAAIATATLRDRLEELKQGQIDFGTGTDNTTESLDNEVDTIRELQELVKDYKDELLDITLGTDEFTIKQKQLTDAQKKLAEALGKTNEKLKTQRTRLENLKIRTAEFLADEKAFADEEDELIQQFEENNQKKIDSDDAFFENFQEQEQKKLETETDNLDATNAAFFESIELRKQAQQDLFDFIVQSSIDLAGSLRGLNQAVADNKIAQLERENEAGRISDEELERRKREIARRTAQADKDLASLQAIVNTAAAITKALNTPPPLNIFLAAATGALGAVQIATIQSRPIPEFAKGTESSPEGMALVGEKGAELVYLGKGSKVMPADNTAKFKDEFAAMQNGDYQDLVFRKYVIPQLLDLGIGADDGTKKAVKKGSSQSVRNTDRIVSAIKSNKEVYLNSKRFW